MTIGIVGAHRVGKTTLCERLSAETDFGFVETDVSEVFRNWDLDPAEKMSFGVRLVIQNKILDHCEEKWTAEKTPFFTDRTPICMLGYTTEDLKKNDVSITDQHYRDYEAYSRRCFESTHRFFGQLMLVQPGIPIVEDKTKETAALDLGLMWRLNFIMMGLAHAPELYTPVYVMPRDCIDLEERTEMCVEAINSAYKTHDEQTKGLRAH